MVEYQGIHLTKGTTVKFSEVKGLSVDVGDGWGIGTESTVYAKEGGGYTYMANDNGVHLRFDPLVEFDDSADLIRFIAANDALVIEGDFEDWATAETGVGHVEPGKVYKRVDWEWIEVTSLADATDSNAFIVHGCFRYVGSAADLAGVLS